MDLDFDDHYFKPGAYLTTHKEHMEMAQNPKLNDITTHMQNKIGRTKMDVGFSKSFILVFIICLMRECLSYMEE